MMAAFDSSSCTLSVIPVPLAPVRGLTAPEVFAPMVRGFNSTGVPVRYIMLDGGCAGRLGGAPLRIPARPLAPRGLADWWYQEVNPGSMLIATPVANPELFPGDLVGFWENVGLPLDGKPLSKRVGAA